MYWENFFVCFSVEKLIILVHFVSYATFWPRMRDFWTQFNGGNFPKKFFIAIRGKTCWVFLFLLFNWGDIGSFYWPWMSHAVVFQWGSKIFSVGVQFFQTFKDSVEIFSCFLGSREAFWATFQKKLLRLHGGPPLEVARAFW